MRDFETPLMAAAKAQKLWPPPHLMASIMAAPPRSAFEDQLAKIQSSLRSDLFKTFSAVEPIQDDFIKRMSSAHSRISHDISAQFLEASKGLATIWQNSSIKRAQLLAESHRLSASRMTQVLRELSAVADLHADPSQIAGVGAVVDAPDAVVEQQSHESAESALVLWWKKQPFAVQKFPLLLFWILQTGAAAVVAEHVKAWMHAGDHEERQIVYNQITQNFGTDTARRLRCVRASMLKVRSEASTAGRIVDSLPHGSAVEVIESQGSWSLIRYRLPHSTELREGWAASGYLSVAVCQYHRWQSESRPNPCAGRIAARGAT